MNPFLSPQGQVPGEMLAFGAPANNAGVPMQSVGPLPPQMAPAGMPPKASQAPTPQILPQRPAMGAPMPAQPQAPAGGAPQGGGMSPGRTALIRSVMARAGGPSKGGMGNYKPPAGMGRPMAPAPRPRMGTPMYKPPGG